MSIEDESSVAESVTDGDKLVSESVDVTPEPNADDFDFAGFVAGSKATRRAVVLYQSNDLRAAVDELDEVIRVQRLAGEDTTDNEALRAEAASELLGTGRTFIVEGRSSEWRKDFTKGLKKDHGLDPDNKKYSDDKRQEHARQVMAHLLAAQLVQPSNATAEGVLALWETSEPEVDKIFNAWRLANERPAVSPDFSRKPSTANRRG